MEGSIFDFLSLASIFILVVINGFFVASEFALVSIRRSRVDELVSQKVRGAKAVTRAVKNLDHYIAGTQIGITLSSLALGWVGEPALVHLIEPWVLLLPLGSASAAVTHTIAICIAFTAITFLHVVLGELIPKSLALQKPERVSLLIGTPMAICVAFFRPLIWTLNGCGNFILRRMGMNPSSEAHSVHSVEELHILVRQSHAAGILDDLEREMLQRTFQFSELVARDIMIPRINVQMLNIANPVEESLSRISSSIHSKMPVYENTEDNIIGIVHVQDVFKRLRKTEPLESIRELMRPPLLVPESIHLDQLLTRFRDNRTHMAIVLDEYGSAAGLVTLEDLIEEVFGEIQDTLEAELPSISKMVDGKIQVRGDVGLHELRSYLGIDLEDPEVSTVAGYVMKQLGRVARLHDTVETPFGSIQVTNMARLRITEVIITPNIPLEDGDVEK